MGRETLYLGRQSSAAALDRIGNAHFLRPPKATELTADTTYRGRPAIRFTNSPEETGRVSSAGSSATETALKGGTSPAALTHIMSSVQLPHQASTA